MNLHPELLEQISRDFGARLRNPARLTQDALILELDNGVDLTVRYAADDAYSLRWRFAIDAAELELGIDTAPLHPTLATRPNHMHLADGRVVADPLTRPDRSPGRNVAAVLEAILASPTLTDRLA